MKCIVLAGGNGGSLWPLSKKNYPIQFAEVCEGRSVFQENIARHIPYCDEFYIFTNQNYEYIVKGQLKIFQELKYKLFLESESLNTTLPIILGAMYAGNEENVLVIGCNALFYGHGFRKCFMRANEIVNEDGIVLFGMPFEEKRTSVGYIKYNAEDVELFVEKPGIKLLDNLLTDGKWFCNTGKYLINVRKFMEILKTDFNEVYCEVENIFNNLKYIGENVIIPYRTDGLNASFERKIVSNLFKAKVVKLEDIKWNLISDWNSIGKIIKQDDLDDIVKKDCENLVVINSAKNKIIVANGVSDAVIVNTDNAVYIEGKNASIDVKDFFVNYKDKYADYINNNSLRYRKWGTYNILSKNDGYIVKEVVIYPGKEMSLHKHIYRSEHWVVVEGTAEITIDDVTVSYEAKTSAFVSEGVYHKVANRTNKNLVIIEVEVGKYINEKDIVSKNYIKKRFNIAEILKLKPVFKDYLWGGTRLRDEFGKDCSWDIIAESWELSTHKDGNSIIDGGKFDNMPFGVFIDKYGDDVIGWKCKAFNKFPILIKFIDSKKALSVQVHPDDNFAMAVENEYGKNEMWYIMDCEENSYIYCGFNKCVSDEEFKERLENKTIRDVLNKIYVKKGDAFFIPAGMVHAIGEGILICEIQQNSNSTYRLYDYERRDKNGNLRELHVEKALKVLNFDKYNPYSEDIKAVDADDGSIRKQLCACKYFEVTLVNVMKNAEFYVDNSSFMAVVILEGNGRIYSDFSEMEIKKGDTLFLPAGIGTVNIKGSCSVILTHI